MDSSLVLLGAMLIIEGATPRPMEKCFVAQNLTAMSAEMALPSSTAILAVGEMEASTSIHLRCSALCAMLLNVAIQAITKVAIFLFMVSDFYVFGYYYCLTYIWLLSDVEHEASRKAAVGTGLVVPKAYIETANIRVERCLKFGLCIYFDASQ